MKLVSKIAAFFDRVIGFLALVGILIMALTMVITDFEVFQRYVLRRASAWTLEITEYSLLYLAFLGAAWLLREDEHIKMDLVINRLRPKAQVWLNIITSTIGAAVLFIITWYGVVTCWDLYQSGLFYHSFLKPPKYIVVAIVPVGCFLLFIQFLRRTWGFIQQLRALSEGV